MTRKPSHQLPWWGLAGGWKLWIQFSMGHLCYSRACYFNRLFQTFCQFIFISSFFHWFLWLRISSQFVKTMPALPFLSLCWIFRSFTRVSSPLVKLNGKRCECCLGLLTSFKTIMALAKNWTISSYRSRYISTRSSVSGLFSWKMNVFKHLPAFNLLRLQAPRPKRKHRIPGPTRKSTVG